jgi:hypothetical protein
MNELSMYAVILASVILVGPIAVWVRGVWAAHVIRRHYRHP